MEKVKTKKDLQEQPRSSKATHVIEDISDKGKLSNSARGNYKIMTRIHMKKFII